jgi:uncharacterized protein YlxW (UPF0749 family)
MEPATGAGVVLTIHGPINGPGVEDLTNDLRNAGAEAIALGSSRIVPGVIVSGEAGSAQFGDERLPDPLVLVAIGPPDKLTGSLTRSGGIIAQLSATQPDVVVEVTPVDRIEVPASDRNLIPVSGRPLL